jgi:hypothetical protein
MRPYINGANYNAKVNGKDVWEKMFVIVSSTSNVNNIAYSPDGITWTAATAPRATVLTEVVYGGGKFIAKSGNYEGPTRNTVIATGIFHSTNGINWTEATTAPAANYYQSICYGNGAFVCSNGNTNIFMYSHDGGITWQHPTTQPPINNNYHHLTYIGNNTFIAKVGFYKGITNSSANTGAISYDRGVNWVDFPSTVALYWNGIASNGKGTAVIIPGNSSNVANYSVNAGAFTATTLPTTNMWNHVSWCNDKFIAIASGWKAGTADTNTYSFLSSNIAAYSYDGITWAGATMPSAGYWNKVVYGNGIYVNTAGYNTNKAAYSTDGISWTATTLPSNSYWNKVVYGNGKCVVFAGKGMGKAGGATRSLNKAAYSTDGITWTAITLPSTSLWTDIAYSTN